MAFINPYIDKILENEKILSETSEIYSKKWNWNEIFGNDNEIVLEIWIGLGNFFSNITMRNPDKNHIWIEIRYKRLHRTFEKLTEKLANNFILIKDKWENISKIFKSQELSQTYLFFPDPWANKERQKKNRIVSETFLLDLYEITKPGWNFIFKTDHKWYFDDSLEIIVNTPWKIKVQSYDYENELDVFDKTLTTEFEELYRRKNIKINYVELVK
jgi:tRNA (guanine-N7-)-methyltransferase